MQIHFGKLEVPWESSQLLHVLLRILIRKNKAFKAEKTAFVLIFPTLENDPGRKYVIALLSGMGKNVTNICSRKQAEEPLFAGPNQIPQIYTFMI